MKKTISAFIAVIILVGVLGCSTALASPWSDSFLNFMNMTKSISQFDKSSGEWTTYLTMCDDQLMFIMVINAGTSNRDITQIFFIGSGNTVDLTFDCGEGPLFYLTLPNVDGQYSYHTIYKDEAPLVKALGTAKKVKITYTTNNKTTEYELSNDEVNNLNLLFGFLDENDFVSAVASSYIDTCDANSLLYPMSTSESNEIPASESEDTRGASVEGSSEMSADRILGLLKNSSIVTSGASISSSKAVPSSSNDSQIYYLINTGNASVFVIYDSSSNAITAVQLKKYMDNPQSLDQKNSMFAMVLTLQDGAGAVAINQIGMSKQEIGTCLNEFYQAWKQ